MTLIIGARCRDGLVIGADRKIQRGGETELTSKIFEFDILGKVLIAAEGLTGIRDDFFLLLNAEISRRRGVETLYEVKLIVEDIINDLTVRYRERIKEDSPIGVFLGGLEALTRGNAVLYYIHGIGYGEQISMRCSGHGGQYAYSLGKFLNDASMCSETSALEIAKRIAFLIMWVSDDVDSTVGGIPDVSILRNNVREIEYLSEEDKQAILVKVNHAKANLPELLSLIEPDEPAPQ